MNGKRKRLPPDDRKAQILEMAIQYFSEVGFASQTRELSSRLDISQPLLYRYFSSKAELVNEVFQTVFMNRWDPLWIEVLVDQTSSLRDRLINFYKIYSKAVYRPEWIRIYMYAGLAGNEFNKKYLRIVREELLSTMCMELRAEFLKDHKDWPRISKLPLEPREIELAWNLHGSMFYWSVRSHIFKSNSRLSFEQKLSDAVDLFLHGARVIYPQLLPVEVTDKNRPR